MPEEVLETIQRVQDLHKLSVNYTSDEIDQVPAPDGFNGQFLKNCWNIIKTDFYKLCKDFQEGSVTLQSINDLIIALIPKKASPETPNYHTSYFSVEFMLKASHQNAHGQTS
jgi:hypothetical protein